MNLKITITALFTFAAVCCYGQDDGSSLPSSETNSAQVSTEELRDPFWPIDHTPKARMVKKTPEKPKEIDPKKIEDIKSIIDWEKAQKLIKVIGLSKKSDGSHIAIIEKEGIVEAGDYIKRTHNGLTYKWKIKTISEKGILPERLEVVPAK
jgi:hypothetical protein